MEPSIIHVTCRHCSYEWDYKGMGWYATCPRCMGKNKVGPVTRQENIKTMTIGGKACGSKDPESGH